MLHWDKDASELDEGEKVSGVMLVTHRQPPKALQPVKEAFVPSAFVTAQLATIVGLRVFAVAPVRKNQLNA